MNNTLTNNLEHALSPTGAHAVVAAVTAAASLVTLYNTAVTATDFVDTGTDGSRFYVRLQFEGVVRYTLDGTTPTATLGFKSADGTVLVVSGTTARRMKVIRTGGSNINIQVQPVTYC